VSYTPVTFSSGTPSPSVSAAVNVWLNVALFAATRSIVTNGDSMSASPFDSSWVTFWSTANSAASSVSANNAASATDRPSDSTRICACESSRTKFSLTKSNVCLAL
jgi:hypothetical protein